MAILAKSSPAEASSIINIDECWTLVCLFIQSIRKLSLNNLHQKKLLKTKAIWINMEKERCDPGLESGKTPVRSADWRQFFPLRFIYYALRR